MFRQPQAAGTNWRENSRSRVRARRGSACLLRSRGTLCLAAPRLLQPLTWPGGPGPCSCAVGQHARRPLFFRPPCRRAHIGTVHRQTRLGMRGLVAVPPHFRPRPSTKCGDLSAGASDRARRRRALCVCVCVCARACVPVRMYAYVPVLSLAKVASRTGASARDQKDTMREGCVFVRRSSELPEIVDTLLHVCGRIASLFRGIHNRGSLKHRTGVLRWGGSWPTHTLTCPSRAPAGEELDRQTGITVAPTCPERLAQRSIVWRGQKQRRCSGVETVCMRASARCTAPRQAAVPGAWQATGAAELCATERASPRARHAHGKSRRNQDECARRERTFRHHAPSAKRQVPHGNMPSKHVARGKSLRSPESSMCTVPADTLLQQAFVAPRYGELARPNAIAWRPCPGRSSQALRALWAWNNRTRPHSMQGLRGVCVAWCCGRGPASRARRPAPARRRRRDRRGRKRGTACTAGVRGAAGRRHRVSLFA